MTTLPAPLINNTIRQRLMEREKALIEKTRGMQQSVKLQGSYNTWTYSRIIKEAKQRLEALAAGLVPVRLGGTFFHLRTLLDEGQYVPQQIIDKAEEVRARFPGALQRVYGWQRDALPAERRRRDPVLTAFYGEREFFVGFWLEVDTPDEDLPEFFGMTVPLLPKPGRGRPRKALK